MYIADTRELFVYANLKGPMVSWNWIFLGSDYRVRSTQDNWMPLEYSAGNFFFASRKSQDVGSKTTNPKQGKETTDPENRRNYSTFSSPAYNSIGFFLF